MKRILVFGATSAICHELLNLYAQSGSDFYLLARDGGKLKAVAADLKARGGTVSGEAYFDFNSWESIAETVLDAKAKLGHLDLILVAHGTLPNAEDCEVSLGVVKACMDDNFTSAAVVIQSAAQQLALQGAGTLAVLPP